MSRRAVLWVAFAVVHLGVAVLGWLLPNQPMGDIYNVYEGWAADAVAGHGIVGVTEPWVYPQLALLPMVFTQGLAWIYGYIVGWAILVTIVDAIAFGFLIGRGWSTGRTVAAWFWLSFIALLGPVGMYRIDAITAPLAILGCLWLVGRPALGSALLSIGMWMKVWPAALIGAALIAVRRRLAVLIGAVAVTAAVVAVVVGAGGARYLFGFVSQQTGRGLQIEAPVSMFYLWGAALRVNGFWVWYDPELLTFQVTGWQVDWTIALMTPLLVIGVTAIAVLGWLKMHRGASFVRLFPPLALALVTAFISLNKVGSPQYVVWLVAPLAFWLVIDRHRAWPLATLALGIALLTQVIYPVLYDQLMVTHPVPWIVLLLSIRNLGMIALCAWSVVRLSRVPVTHRAPVRIAVRADVAAAAD